jgi:hypothetical protein
MRKLITARRAAICGAVAILSIGCVTGAALALPASHASTTIHACASKSSGALRLAAHCKSSERAVSWSKVGPRGPAGLSQGFANSLNGEISVSSSVNLTSVRLPKGSYLLFATATAVNGSGSPATFTCDLSLAGSGQTEASPLTVAPDGYGQVSLSLAGTIKPATDTVLTCSGGAASTYMENSKIEAIQVKSLTIPPPV